MAEPGSGPIRNPRWTDACSAEPQALIIKSDNDTVDGMFSTIDPDTRAVTALLRSALTRSGMSQGSFAHALGTSGSRFSTYLTGSTRPSGHFCMRARRLADALAAADSAGFMSAPATSAAMQGYLRAGEPEWAWRMLLQGRDHLQLMLSKQDEELIGSWEAAPGATGSGEFDALLAALTLHEFNAAGLAAPEWAHVEPLSQPWVIEHPFLTRDRVIAKTPEWLRELNIFVPGRDLITA